MTYGEAVKYCAAVGHATVYWRTIARWLCTQCGRTWPWDARPVPDSEAR